MIAFVFGIIFFAMIYFYDKSKDEKNLRESNQRKNEREKSNLEYQLKKVKEENRTKELIVKIKDHLNEPVSSIIERDNHTYTTFNSITAQMEKRDCLVTTIKYGNSENYKSVRIFEKIPYQPNLEIYYKVFDVKNAHFPEDKLIIDSIQKTSDSEIINLYREMMERNNRKN